MVGVLKEKAGGQCDWSQVSAGTSDWELGSERNHVGAAWRADCVGPARALAFIVDETGGF